MRLKAEKLELDARREFVEDVSSSAVFTRCRGVRKRIIIVSVVTVMIVIIVIGSVARTFVHGNEFSKASAKTNRISRKERERERERERSSRPGPRVGSSLFNNLVNRCLFLFGIVLLFLLNRSVHASSNRSMPPLKESENLSYKKSRKFSRQARIYVG